MQVAKTILEQLGGAGRLQVMTGAYNFVAYPNGVSFKFKNRKVNYVKITLNGMDLYDIEFLKLTVNSQKKVAEFEDIYFDQLIDIFEDTTGMYLRLFAKGGRLKKDENIEMIFGQLKQIHHHEKELRSIIKKDKSIEPWVIAKLQRATTDLADVTHYEDNKTTKYAKGGAVSDEINELIYEAMYPLDVTSQAWGALKMAYYDVDTIEEKLEYIEEARFHTNIDDPLYYKLLELEREIERIQSNEEDEDEYAKGGGVEDIKVGDKLFIDGVEYIFISKEKQESKIAPNHIEYYFSPVYAKNKPLIVDFRNEEDFKAWLKNKKYAKGGKLTEKDFVRNKEFTQNNVLIKLEKLSNPNYYRANYIDLNDNEKISSYGSSNWEDVVYDINNIKYSKGGGVVNYPSFEISKGIPYDGKFLNPGYYTYIDREVGGKGVYINIMNRETTGFSIEDLKLIQEKYPDNFSITFGSMAKGGGIEDDITRAKSNATDKIDFEYYAKQHAGDSWNTMSKQEKAELMSELRDNWFNDSYAKGGNIYNYLVGTNFKYLGELHKVKKVEKYPTYTILVTTENRRFRMDILQEQGVKFADKPERKKRQPETPEQKRRKNAFKIKQLQYERKQLLIDMEQEAEPEGGPIANRYGRMLNKIDKQIAQLSGKDYFATGGNIEEEVSYIENRIYNLEQLKQVAGEDEQNYYSRLIQDLEREKSELLNKTSSEVPENKKKFWFFKDGGNLDSEKPLIYIEDFDAIYSGKSYGQWLDLSKFDSGQEVMEALSDIASNWSERKGEKIETISVTDYENIPRSLYHEFMSSKDYDFIIKAYKVSKQVNIPMWVLGDVMNDYSDSFEHTLEGIKEFIEENYLGFAEDDSDLAYDYIEKNGGIKSLAEEIIKRNFDYEKYGRDVRLGMDSEQEEELGYDKLDDYDLGKELVEQYSDIRELDEKTLKSNFNYKLFGDYLTSFYANYGGHYFRN